MKDERDGIITLTKEDLKKLDDLEDSMKHDLVDKDNVAFFVDLKKRLKEAYDGGYVFDKDYYRKTLRFK